MENHHQYLNHHKNFLSDKLGFKKTIFEENGELLAKYKGFLPHDFILFFLKFILF